MPLLEFFAIIKFMYSEKANKVDKISKFLFELLRSVEKMVK